MRRSKLYKSTSTSAAYLSCLAVNSFQCCSSQSTFGQSLLPSGTSSAPRPMYWMGHKQVLYLRFRRSWSLVHPRCLDIFSATLGLHILAGPTGRLSTVIRRRDSPLAARYGATAHARQRWLPQRLRLRYPRPPGHRDRYMARCTAGHGAPDRQRQPTCMQHC